MTYALLASSDRCQKGPGEVREDVRYWWSETASPRRERSGFGVRTFQARGTEWIKALPWGRDWCSRSWNDTSGGREGWGLVRKVRLERSCGLRFLPPWCLVWRVENRQLWRWSDRLHSHAPQPSRDVWSGGRIPAWVAEAGLCGLCLSPPGANARFSVLN